MTPATPWTIASVREALLAKKVSARELTAEFFARIEKRNPELNAFLTLSPERAYAQADRVDNALARHEALPPLAGVPVALKDVLSTAGIRTTCGSKILENYVPPYDGTAVERLDQAGAIFLGKTNCDEFAMGSSNENSAYGPVRNPKALDRVPGGSSGGSAAAVADGLAMVALGTDTGGSIRQPGACCGIPAFMPTYGRVSRYGLIAFASSLDRIGPFANAVEDVAKALGVIAGYDENDSTSARVPLPDYTRERGFGPEVKRRIMLGTYALSAGYYDAYYLKAQKVRALISRDFSEAFQKVDAIVTPTAPTPAFKLGERTEDPLQMYLADIYTVTGSLSGIPGISVPCGKTQAGLPVGLQIFGPHFKEGQVLRLAHAFEKAGGAAL